MTTPENINTYEAKITDLVEAGLKNGLNSWEWLDILLRKACDMHIKATIEYRIKQK